MTHQPKQQGSVFWNWLVAMTVVVALLGCYAMVSDDGPTAEELSAQDQAAIQGQLEHDAELRAEFARVARAAHQQGMSEALASVRGTERGETFERTCARLWAGQQP